MRTISFRLLLLTIIMLVSACAGKSAPDTTASEAEPTEDITAPPQMIKRAPLETQEGDPEEAVSFDDWRKQREEEAQTTEQPDD